MIRHLYEKINEHGEIPTVHTKAMAEPNAAFTDPKDEIIEKLEKKVQELAQNNFILIHAVNDIEEAAKLTEKNLDILFNQYNTFSCNLCEKEFESESLLRNHTESDHRSTKLCIKQSSSRSKSPCQTECCPDRCCAGTYSPARNCQGPGFAGQPGENRVCCNHELKRKS